MAAYGSVEDATSYHTQRNNDPQWDAINDKSAALQRGSDYIDQRYREKLKSGRWVSRFPGQRANGRNQDQEWPRKGAVDYEGSEIPSDEVPIEVIHAAYEAALREGMNPGSLSPDYVASNQVTQETFGPVSFTYAKPQQGEAGNRPEIPVIDEIIAPVLVPRYEMPAIRTV